MLHAGEVCRCRAGGAMVDGFLPLCREHAGRLGVFGVSGVGACMDGVDRAVWGRCRWAGAGDVRMI